MIREVVSCSKQVKWQLCGCGGCFYSAPGAIERMPLEVVVSERMGPIPDAQPPIEMLVDQDPTLHEAAPQRGGHDLERHAAVLHGVVVGDRPVVLDREDALQVGAMARHERAPALRGRDTQCRRW